MNMLSSDQDLEGDHLQHGLPLQATRFSSSMPGMIKAQQFSNKSLP
jgi:hypothetical protein